MAFQILLSLNILDVDVFSNYFEDVKSNGYCAQNLKVAADLNQILSLVCEGKYSKRGKNNRVEM